MKNCIDENSIQAFLDGESSPEISAEIANHIADCDACAMLLADIEEQNSVVFSALENEINIPVPTHRLWSRITSEIEKSRPSGIWRFLNLGALLRPSMAAFASLLIIGAGFAFFWQKQSNDNNELRASSNTVSKKIEAVPVNQPPADDPGDVRALPRPKARDENIMPAKASKPLLRNAEKEQFHFVKASYEAPRSDTAPKRADTRLNTKLPRAESPANNLIDGEENYIKTIDTLAKTSNLENFRPSMRVDYERNIAMIDNAIKTMQKKARKNPKDAGAKQILFASYQNKIELMNSMAEKNELIASLR